MSTHNPFPVAGMRFMIYEVCSGEIFVIPLRDTWLHWGRLSKRLVEAEVGCQTVLIFVPHRVSHRDYMTRIDNANRTTKDATCDFNSRNEF